MSWDSGWYPPSRPRKVANGLKARTARGAIGSERQFPNPSSAHAFNELDPHSLAPAA